MVSATKKPGRPATGVGTPVQVRLTDEQLLAVDKFRASQPGIPSRPEAIRQLMEKGLSSND